MLDPRRVTSRELSAPGRSRSPITISAASRPSTPTRICALPASSATVPSSRGLPGSHAWRASCSSRPRRGARRRPPRCRAPAARSPPSGARARDPSWWRRGRGSRRGREPRAGRQTQRAATPRPPSGCPGDDPLDLGIAQGERARLVEQHRPAPPSRSRAPAPFTITPARAARESPATNAIGAARISGHGVATTITASPRTESPDTSQASPATASVNGRKNAAYRSAMRVNSARSVCAASTRRTTAAYALSAADETMRRSNASPALAVPRADTLVSCEPDRHRLAGERRLVHDGLDADDDAVCRHDLAGTHRDDVPGAQLVDADLHHGVARVPVGDVAAPARRAARSSRRARPAAHASSAAPPDIISATIAAARYSPSARAQTIATSAIASTPTSRRRSDCAVETTSGTSTIAAPAAQTALPQPSSPVSQSAPPTTIEPSAITGSPLSRSCRACSGTKAALPMATSSSRRSGARAAPRARARRPRPPGPEGR